MKEEQNSLMVSIRCITYNHEPYIRKCLEGFVIQKTNFRFEAIVHDDASTDKTADIIREYEKKYPDIIKPIYEKENQYSKHDGSLQRIMNNACKGKYIAICEGDDYWTDPFKLQKQVDFLECHSDYGLVYTDFNIFKSKTHEMKYALINSGQFPIINSFEEHLFKAAFIAPMSWVLRKDLLKFIDNYKGTDGSFVLALEIFLHSKVYFLNEVTCVYRMHEGSISHQQSFIKHFIYEKGVHDTQMYYLNKYKLNEKIRKLDWFYKKYYPYLIAINETKEFDYIIDYLNNLPQKKYINKIKVIFLGNPLKRKIIHLIYKIKYRNIK